MTRFLLEPGHFKLNFRQNKTARTQILFNVEIDKC
jgi:hypothetical protein